MALLNRFNKLNDRGETGIFTFIVTRSVTRDFHRDATTKDFCFGYHRWAISFQRPSEKILGVHLLLRNPSPNTACVVDFSLTLINRQHFSQNQVFTKRQAKFTITNPMQVSMFVMRQKLYYYYYSYSFYLPNSSGHFRWSRLRLLKLFLIPSDDLICRLDRPIEMDRSIDRSIDILMFEIHTILCIKTKRILEWLQSKYILYVSSFSLSLSLYKAMD